jgi:hypothetical protein
MRSFWLSLQNDRNMLLCMTSWRRKELILRHRRNSKRFLKSVVRVVRPGNPAYNNTLHDCPWIVRSFRQVFPRTVRWLLSNGTGRFAADYDIANSSQSSIRIERGNEMQNVFAQFIYLVLTTGINRVAFGRTRDNIDMRTMLRMMLIPMTTWKVARTKTIMLCKMVVSMQILV